MSEISSINFSSSSDALDSSDADSAKVLVAHVVRSTFGSFADEIMSLYGSQKDEDRLETLSSTPIPELKEECDKVSYRILWLEALLNESKLEFELINSVLESSELKPES
jgi:hypothetical protein